MKKHIMLVTACLLGAFALRSQTPGWWTWIGGGPTIVPSHGVYRVPSPTNWPPPRYASAHWTDLDGNFWIFGGTAGLSYYNDLWKYEVASGLWTWMHGSSTTGSPGVSGTMGVPGPLNTPAARGYGSACWTGVDGNLWLFGGADGHGDLWRFDITTLEWTWMKGSLSGYSGGSYGIKGVPAPSNTPPSRCENRASWVDASGDLWLYGGYQSVSSLPYGFGDMWKYTPSTNIWTWINGPSGGCRTTPNYGTLGIPSASNHPGCRSVYNSWMDELGRMYFFGGMEGEARFADLWRYDPATDLWTWLNGSPINNSPGLYPPICTPSKTAFPPARAESTAQWQLCGTFYMYGGTAGDFLDKLADLWSYDVATNTFTLHSGSAATELYPFYGTQGVPGPTRTPGARVGSCSFKDSENQFWLFGGCSRTGADFMNDLWKYVPDTLCGPIGRSTKIAHFTVDTLSICDGNFIFHDSIMGMLVNWDFGDGSTSTSSNPTHNYPSPGSYEVLLVGRACNTNDTARMTLVVPTNSEDTLFVPNAFSPNHDNLNDCYYVVPAPIHDNFSLDIFTRWGDLVFHADYPSQCWDGKWNGINAPEGVYLAKVQALDCNGQIQQLTTYLTLIR